jgi:MOSC domain-containing protein YiiM
MTHMGILVAHKGDGEGIRKAETLCRMQHRTTAELTPHLEHLRSAPREVGELRLVVSRPAAGHREILTEAKLDPVLGLVGDSWSERPHRRTGTPDADRQLTVMGSRMVALLSEDPSAQALAGDQLYVDLDLSVANLPAGTRLRVGSAVIEVTAPPHTGCAKFVRHFGDEAMRFVNGRDGRPLRLRGLNARVVSAGTVRPGDTVAKQP